MFFYGLINSSLTNSSVIPTFTHGFSRHCIFGIQYALGLSFPSKSHLNILKIFLQEKK